MATIRHQLAINAPVEKIYAAISRPEAIGAWWAKQTPVETAGGLVLEHDPGPDHGVVRLRVVEAVPCSRVEWECISTHPGSSPASAWTGTHIVFEVAERGSAASRFMPGSHGRTTTLDFRQTGYDDQSEFAGFNNFAWGQVLQNLKQVVEAGESG